MRITTSLAVLFALAVSDHYLAVANKGPAGDTSGPAVGTPVEPPTVVQKQNPYIPPQKKSGQSGTSAGAPGIEGGVDTQSGQSSGGKRW
jgi:hypothetical protein